MRSEPEPTYIGQSFEDFLKEQGNLEETNAVAMERVAKWHRRVSTLSSKTIGHETD